MNMHIQKQDKITHLGANSDYPDQYAPALLEALPRARGRDLIGVDERQLPFSGFDLWTAFELSWLNGKGKPVVGIGEFTFPHSSSNLIESKSFKLYLNSFNQTPIIVPKRMTRPMLPSVLPNAVVTVGTISASGSR